MKKILLPIDGSERSLRTIETAKRLVPPGQAEITLLTVLSGQMHIGAQIELERGEKQAKANLEAYAQLLPGYPVNTATVRGEAGEEIVHFAREGGFDEIIMTRSSRGPLRKLGSVTTYVVRNADFANLTVIRESDQ